MGGRRKTTRAVPWKTNARRHSSRRLCKSCADSSETSMAVILFTSSRANSSTDLRSTPTGFAEISALLCRILKPSGRVRFAWSGSLSSVGPNSASVESQCVTIRGVVSATGTEFVGVQFVVASCSDALTFIKSDLNSLKFRGHARLWPTRHFCDHILFVFRAPSQSQPFQIRRRSHLRVFFLRNLSLSAEV